MHGIESSCGLKNSPATWGFHTLYKGGPCNGSGFISGGIVAIRIALRQVLQRLQRHW